MKRTGAWHAGGSVCATACSISGHKRNSPGSAGLLLELGAPRRVSEVAGRDDADALARRPRGEMFEVEVAARGARIFRVDVQVGVKAHGGPARSRLRETRGSYAARLIRLKAACG